MSKKVIWKHALLPTAFQVINIPHGAKLLTVATQGDTPTVWFECDPEAPVEERHVIVVGTGHIYEGDAGRYLGTCFVSELVLHIFEPEH